MKYLIILFIVIAIIISSSIIKLNYIKPYVEAFYINNLIKVGKIENVKFPFKNIRDENNNNTNVIALVAPFRNKAHLIKYFNLLNKGYQFIGITSYLQFPGKIYNKYDPANNDNMANYINKCFAWMYCFNNPTNIFMSKKPLIQMAQSDFTNPAKIKPLNLPIKWDFVYVCLKDNNRCNEGWNSINRNWKLAKKCFYIMCLKYNLKGVIIGRENCTIDSKLKPFLTFYKQLKYRNFINIIDQCKFTFLPNIIDASPRILTESLCLNKPVLINSQIIGGWKYINKQTGEFFTNEDDMELSLTILLKNIEKSIYQPRNYFKNFYGPLICGPKLARFIKKYFTNFTPCKSAEPYCCD